jgi:hypothetical protein
VDGYIPDRLAVPIYLVFPRLFTCPSLHAANFKIEFSVTLQVTLKGTAELPLFLCTSTPTHRTLFLFLLSPLSAAMAGGHVLKKDFPLLLVRK